MEEKKNKKIDEDAQIFLSGKVKKIARIRVIQGKYQRLNLL